MNRLFLYTIRIVIPPSIDTVSPVMKSFVTNSAIRLATSSGCPTSPMGVFSM